MMQTVTGTCMRRGSAFQRAQRCVVHAGYTTYHRGCLAVLDHTHSVDCQDSDQPRLQPLENLRQRTQLALIAQIADRCFQCRPLLPPEAVVTIQLAPSVRLQGSRERAAND